MSSWYNQNVKKMNELLQRLLRYDLQGSFDQELKPKEIINVIQNMASEIKSLQNKSVSLETTIGLLKIEAENLQKILSQKLTEPKVKDENPI